LGEFISPNDSYPEIYIYPGNSFEHRSLDNNPPRKYPVFFGLRNNDYYKIVWNFGNHLQPQSWEDIVFKKGYSVIGSFIAEYDSAANSLTVVRQYKNLSAIYKAEYSENIETIRDNLKIHDKTSIFLQKK
jgi:hypothetical protein